MSNAVITNVSIMGLIGAERFDWSDATKWMVEDVLLRTWSDIVDLYWLMGTDEEYLDRKHGIDVIATLVHGQSLTVQAKVLSTDYHTITIEGMSPVDLGDWSTCIAQFYLVVYASDPQSMLRWCIVDNARLALAYRRLAWRTSQNVVSGLSSFHYVDFADVLLNAPDAVVAYGGDWQ